jgi:hypothetical protein
MTPETTITPNAPGGNFFSRLMGIYFSPGETFKGFVANPSILAPIIGLILLGGIVGYMFFAKVDFAQVIAPQVEQMVEAGRIQKEQAPQVIAMQATFAKYMALVMGFVGNILFSLIVAGLFKLVSLVLGKENTYKSLLSVTLYTFLAVGILSSLLLVAMIFIRGSEFDIQNPLGTNLGSLLAVLFDQSSLPKFIWSLARAVDIFYLWIIVLLGIGYAAVTRRLKAMTAGMILGALYFGLAIVGAALGAIFGAG